MSKKAASASEPSGQPFAEPEHVVTSTMNEVPGYTVERVLGTVYGLTNRSVSVGATFSIVGRAFAGGESKPFTKLLYEARNQAVERLVGECMARGGNALVAMRFETSTLLDGWVQVVAYGTACVVRKIEGSAVMDARGGDVQA